MPQPWLQGPQATIADADVGFSIFASTPLLPCEHAPHDGTEIHGYCSRTPSACKDTPEVGHELLIDDLSCSIDHGVEIGLALFDMDNFGLQIPIGFERGA